MTPTHADRVGQSTIVAVDLEARDHVYAVNDAAAGSARLRGCWWLPSTSNSLSNGEGEADSSKSSVGHVACAAPGATSLMLTIPTAAGQW